MTEKDVILWRILRNFASHPSSMFKFIPETLKRAMLTEEAVSLS